MMVDLKFFSVRSFLIGFGISGLMYADMASKIAGGEIITLILWIAIILIGVFGIFVKK